MSGAHSRNKGKRWEQEVARLMRPLFGDRVGRGWQAHQGAREPDVTQTPYWLECKHGRLVNLRAALAQAIRDTDGRPPVVIAKDDRTPPVVVMRLSDWMELLGKRLPEVVVDALEEEEP